LGDSDALDVAELVARLDGASMTKIGAAGSRVVVAPNSGHGRGILSADVAWRGSAIDQIRYFPA
jgi:hypothetical protein